jgi:hypothetical protein
MTLNSWPHGSRESEAWTIGFCGWDFELPGELWAAYYEGVIASSLAA